MIPIYSCLHERLLIALHAVYSIPKPCGRIEKTSFSQASFTSQICCSFLSAFQYLKTLKLKICCERKSQLVVSCQVVTNPCCGLAVTFCSFISHLIGRKAINIRDIFSDVHSFMGKTVNTVVFYKSVEVAFKPCV